MDINDKIKLWEEITEVNVEDNRWEINFNGDIPSWDIKHMNDSLKEVFKYDTNGVYFNIYLEEYLNRVLNNKTLSINKLLTEYDKHKEYLNKCRKLKQSLLEVEPFKKELLEKTSETIKHYGLKENNLSLFDIITLKINAKRNIESLNINQIKRGETKNSSIKFIDNILMMNDIDSLIQAINNENNNFISLVFIKEKEEECSYFCFTVKNGENIYLISDKPNFKHPNQKYMRRCKGRDIEERINKTFFPYELTHIELSKYSANFSNNIVLDKKYAIIGNLKDIPLEESLWITNMFDEINNKIFKNKFQCKDLSYVGGTIKHKMLNEGTTSLEIYNNFPKLELPYINNPKNIELEYDYESLHLFDDIIDQFKDKVNLDYSNLISNVDKREVKLIGREYDIFNKCDKLLCLNVNDIGTKEEIEYRQKWIARYNFALQIDALYEKYYKENRDRIKEWLKKYLWDNIENIMKHIIFEEVKVEKRMIKDCDYWYHRDSIYLDGNNNSYHTICPFSKKKATILLKIQLNDVNDILELTNLTREEIPKELRNWSSKPREHKGNCILDNIDPCDWVIKDYWSKLCNGIIIPMTKSVYNNFYKKYGKESDKFWLK